jgi:predicted ATPase/DNA-binding CsgD family transcriptional regulator/Tfp pilus assembly protein PilF
MAATRSVGSRRSRRARSPSGKASARDLPVGAGGLLGRAEQVSQLVELLGRARLVTLTGAPGIGKSRLAVRVAEELGDGKAGATRLVELAPLARPVDVPRAVASALSVEEVSGQDLADTLIARLSNRRLLLVLDNCEHLVSACASLVERLLCECPEVSLLATSREPLGLAAERVWEVAPLAVPTEGRKAPPEQLEAYPSVGLFVERARAIQPGFALNAYVAPAVAEICRRLDGIPLAIELAAARVESLTPKEIARRLDDRFNLLTEGAPGDPPRHHTLEAALDWSHELLTAPERALLRRLSVFVGGSEVKAVEAVCAGGEVPAGQVRELLAELVAKSLVVDASDPAGRCRLLETIRAYAAERLEQTGETPALRGAHARFYLALAEQAEPELTGPDQQDWLAGLEAERENLRAALEWSVAHGHGERALRLAGALVLFWRVRCHFSEGRELLDAAVATGEGQAPGLRAKALWGAGFMALMMTDIDAAMSSLQESLALFRELDDHQGCARALLVLANCMRSWDRAVSLYEDSAVEARAAGDAWCLGHALALPGFDYLSVGELPVARGLFEDCLEVARGAEDRQSLRLALCGLGAVTLRQGELGLAGSLLEEAVAVSGGLGDDYGKAWPLHCLGELAIARGDYGRARELLDEAIVLARRIGALDIVLNSLGPLGRVARAQGDRRSAHRIFEHARDMATSDTRGPALQELGELAAEEGDAETARRLFEEALRLARARGGKHYTARALFGLGQLAREEGERRRAVVLHDEALELWWEIGSAPEVVASLEAIAGLAAQEGRFEQAARLLGAAGAVREQRGYARLPWESSSCEADLFLVREALSEQAFKDALAKGAHLSLQKAAAKAARRHRTDGRPVSGWSSLTESERQVAILVSAGLTNPQIAPRLYISPRTVKRRLVRVFAKLGVESRTGLARAVHRRGYDAHGERRLG